MIIISENDYKTIRCETPNLVAKTIFPKDNFGPIHMLLTSEECPATNQKIKDFINTVVPNWQEIKIEYCRKEE